MSHKLLVDLIGREDFLTRIVLIFLSHAGPGIRNHDISPLDGFHRVSYELNAGAREFGIFFCLLGHRGIRLVVCRRSSHKGHTGLGTAIHVGVGHIVAVAHISHFEALEVLTLMLLNG